MSNTIKTIAVSWLALFLGATAPSLQAQLRTELIERDRVAKEANLTPETTPKAERIFVSVQRSLPYRLLTGEVEGLGVAFGTIVPGSGFAIGPHYRRDDLLGGRLKFSAEARASINQSYLGRLDLSYKIRSFDRVALDFSVVHRDISEMPYYGAGPDSRKTGRSDYRLEDTNVEFRPAARIFKGLRAGAIGSFLAVNAGAGHSSRYISTEQQFGPDTTPGIDRQTNFWRGGGFVEYDWRDNAASPTSGGKYLAQYVRYLDHNLGAYSFLRLDLDATQYVPLFNGTRVIALHGASSLATSGSSQQVPFYLQPTLGGPDTLRGYRINRFYGDNSALLSAEYRWQLSPILDMAVFADGGKVFNRWEQWNFHNIQSDVGFGLRLKSRTRTVFSIDTGFSHEGFQVWFRANNLI